jgi:hypothetical protein
MYARYSYRKQPARAIALSRKPVRPTRYRLGNVGDYGINSPGFPGSSTMFMYGMGQEPDVAPVTGGFDFSSLIKSGTELVKTAGEQLVPAYLQIKIQQENLARARKGLPPLSPAEYAPAMRVQVAPSGEALRVAGMGIGTIALLGAGALAVWAMTRRR